MSENDVMEKPGNNDLLKVAVRVYRESAIVSDIDPQYRIVEDIESLSAVVSYLRDFDAKMKIVLTMGTFDLFHVGHARYIRKARQQGNFIIVGVDDDEKARGRKGENRPAVPFVERSELLAYMRHVDLIAKKSHTLKKWEMIRVVRPDVLIAVEGTYSEEEITELHNLCGSVIVLERQAKTSTSAKLRKMVLDGADVFRRILQEELPKFVGSVYDKMKKEE